MRLLLFALLLAPSLLAQNAVVYCSFEVASTSACAPASAVTSFGGAVNSNGKFGDGLRMCHSATCAGDSLGTITLNRPLIPSRRGTMAGWLEVNDDTAIGSLAAGGSGQMQIFKTPSGTNGPSTVLFLTNALPPLSCVAGNPTVCTTGSSEPHELVTGDTVTFFTYSGTGWSGLVGTYTATVTSTTSFSIAYDSSSDGAWTSSKVSAYSNDKYSIVWRTYYLYSQKSWREVSTERVSMPQGTWHHFAFTWTGTSFVAYMDGLLSIHYSGNLIQTGAGTIHRSAWQSFGTVHSPLPNTDFGTLTLTSDNPIDVTLDEFGVYDWQMSAAEVAATYSATAGARTISGTHGLSMPDVRWSPEAPKVWFVLDAGNDYLSRVNAWQVEVQFNGSTLASANVAPDYNGGYSGAIPLPAVMATGTYTLNARAYGPSGLLGAVTSTYPYTQDPWVADTAGTISTTPSPWTDVAVSSNAPNADLSVWGRTYTISGGFGLPQQITSKDTTSGTAISLLATPLALTLMQGGVPLTLQSLGLVLTKITGPNISFRGRARTTNAASGNQLDITFDGTLVYDGYLLLSMTAQPVTGPVLLDTATLNVQYSSTVSKYLWNYSDAVQPFAPQYLNAIGTMATGAITTGSVSNAIVPAKLKSYLASDDVMLFMSHPKGFAGYMIGTSNTGVQTWTKNSDSSVTLAENFVNYSSSAQATISTPVTWTVAFMAGPARPQIAGQRAWAVSFAAGQKWMNASVPDVFNYSQTPATNWATFGRLDPSNWPAWSSTPATDRSNNRTTLPFVNAHILLGSSDIGWVPSHCDDADGQDGWDSTPAPCSSAAWAWVLDTMTNSTGYGGTTNVVDGYYIDESYGFTPSNNPLSGGQKLGDFGEYVASYDDFRERAKNIRMYNILHAAGKTGNWAHITDYPQLDVLSHFPLVLEGESSNTYTSSDSPTDADHWDRWNAGGSLLNPQAAANGAAGLNYRGAETGKRTGWEVSWWRGLPTSNTTNPAAAFWPLKQRFAQCLHSLHDSLQSDGLQDEAQVRYDFFGNGADSIFHPYWEQAEITSSDANVIVSYYTRPNGTALLYAGNSGSTDSTSDTLTVNPAAMGLTGATTTAQLVNWNAQCVMNQTGTANVSGTTVTWVSGSDFSSLSPDVQGLPITFNGGTTWYPLSSVTDSQHLVLRSSPGTMSGVAYQIAGCADPSNYPAMQTYTFQSLALSSDQLSVTIPRRNCAIVKLTNQ